MSFLEEWLAGYDVEIPSLAPPPTTPRMPGVSQAPQMPTVAQGPRGPTATGEDRLIRYWLPRLGMGMVLAIFLSFVLHFGFVAAAHAAEALLDRFFPTESTHDCDCNDGSASIKPPDIFAVLLQVGTPGKALREANPALATVVEKWNSAAGQQNHGVSQANLPIFYPEPREGWEREFNQLVADGLGDYDLHLFPYESEPELRRVSEECGVGSVARIKQWSTWRDGSSYEEANHCRQGGYCLVLSKGCDGLTKSARR